jgi:hypothetical protein
MQKEPSRTIQYAAVWVAVILVLTAAQFLSPSLPGIFPTRLTDWTERLPALPFVSEHGQEKEKICPQWDRRPMTKARIDELQAHPGNRMAP